MLVRTKYYVFVDEESFFMSFDGLDNDKIAIKKITIQKDGERQKLETKDYTEALDLNGDSSLVDYIKDHPEEVASMMTGAHGAINLSCVAVNPAGKVALLFDDSVITGNLIWLKADVLPSIVLEGKGDFISVVTRYDISIKREEGPDDVLTQSVEIKEYFGDHKLSVVYRTAWLGERMAVEITQY